MKRDTRVDVPLAFYIVLCYIDNGVNTMHWRYV